MDVTNPITEHFEEIILGDSMAVAPDTEIPFYLSMQNYNYLTLQWIPDDDHFTLEVGASIQHDKLAEYCKYEKVTHSWFGAAKICNHEILERGTPITVRWIQIIVSRENTTKMGTFTLYARKAYYPVIILNRKTQP